MEKAYPLSELFSNYNEYARLAYVTDKSTILFFKTTKFENHERKCHGCTKPTIQRANITFRSIYRNTIAYKGSCCSECLLFLKFKLGKA